MATSSSHSCCLILILSLYVPAMVLQSDAGRSLTEIRTSFDKKELKSLRHYAEMWALESSTSGPYGVGSPFESLAPVSMPQGQTTPPYCMYPPFTPTNPSLPPPAFYVPPIFPILIPPPGSSGSYPIPSGPQPNPPQTVPSPPSYVPGHSPTPPTYVPIPTPSGNPPSFEPSPPSYTPTPGGSSGGTPGGGGGTPGGGFAPNPPVFVVPSPPVFQPPVIYPAPAVPPPPHHGESLTLWCVAKPSVPDPIIQEALNYACGSGAECDSIQPNGNCYQPDTLIAHASYAFNSYWQMTKVGGGTCEFGGTAILVTVDPSYDGCHFTIT